VTEREQGDGGWSAGGGDPDGRDRGPPRVKRIMYVNRRPPHGTIYAQEALEVVLIGAAFEQDVSVAYMDDGVYQLRRGQDTRALGIKDFSPTLRAFDDFEVRAVYVEAASLERRGLVPADLVIPVEVVDSAELGRLMEAQDVVLSF
jgi:tRNA 2-thiouridine synthesizing protein C